MASSAPGRAGAGRRSWGGIGEAGRWCSRWCRAAKELCGSEIDLDTRVDGELQALGAQVLSITRDSTTLMGSRPRNHSPGMSVQTLETAVHHYCDATPRRRQPLVRIEGPFVSPPHFAPDGRSGSTCGTQVGTAMSRGLLDGGSQGFKSPHLHPQSQQVRASPVTNRRRSRRPRQHLGPHWGHARPVDAGARRCSRAPTGRCRTARPAGRGRRCRPPGTGGRNGRA
jgi:hypothetical protein